MALTEKQKEEALAVIKQKISPKRRAVTLRLEQVLLDRIDAQVVRMAKIEGFTVSRSEMIRALLVQRLNALEGIGTLPVDDDGVNTQG